MAECKNSFVLYNEFIETFEALSDEEAGKLVKHLFRYVNDQNPETDSPMVKLAFIPIKQQLKRDLKKYEKYIEKQSLNGAKGGRPSKPKETQKTQPFKEEPKKAEDVYVDVDDNLSDYSEKQFLEDWGTIRKKLRNLPTNIPRLKPFDLINFNKHKKDYSREQFQEAMRGLFGQEVINYTAMITQPTHFLENVEKYYNAFISKDFKQYGSKQVQH